MSVDTTEMPRVRYLFGHLGNIDDPVLSVMTGLIFELIGRQNRWVIGWSDAYERPRRSAAVVHFSLLMSYKRHDLEPWVYYRDILVRLPCLSRGGR